MKNKRTITLLGLVVAIGVLLCAYLIILKINNTTVEDDTTDTVTVYVNELSADDMTEISYTNSNGSFAFVKTATDIWVLAEDEEYPIKNSMIKNMASAVSSLEAVRTVENGDEDSFGFDSPTLTVTGTYSDGTTLSLTVGITNSFNGNTYLKDDLTGNIYLVSSTLTVNFDYSLLSLTDTDSFPSDIDEDYLTSLTVRDEEGQSNIVSDSDGVENLYSLMESLDFSAESCYYTEGKELSEYGISDSSAYIELSYKAETEVSGDSEDETVRADATFKILFGSNHTVSETSTDSDGEEYVTDSIVYYYTVPDSKLVYSVSADTYEDIMSYITYTAPETESSDTEE